jgi:FAD synthetase
MGRCVVCAGTFDFLHPGHMDFLEQARALGEELVVIVARDETVKRLKGFMPTHAEGIRANRIIQSGIADRVVLGNLDDDLFHILDQLRPDVIALGYDQRVSEESIVKRCPECLVIRLAPFHPEKYKSSFFRNKAKE